MLNINNKNSDNNPQSGFITMIVMMLIILGVVIFFAYKNVVNR